MTVAMRLNARRSLVLGLLATVGGCDRPTPTPKPAPEPVVDAPEPQPEPEIPPLPQPDELRRAILMGEVETIATQLECLRGESFTTFPRVDVQSTDEFRAFAGGEYDKWADKPRGQQDERVIQALGFLPAGLSMRDAMLEAASEQVAAYYDPREDAFYIVMEMGSLSNKSVMAHELVHALQHRRANLLRFIDGDHIDTFDEGLALPFLWEGEATAVGNAWTFASGVRDILGPLAPTFCGDDATRPIDLLWDAVAESAREQAQQTRHEIEHPGLLISALAAALEPSSLAGLRTMRKLPNYLFFSMLWPYMRGAHTSMAVFQRAGNRWDIVNRLYDDPVEYTHVMLHPELVGEYIPSKPPSLDPLESLAPTDGWQVDPDDRVGELGFFVWLMDGGLDEPLARALSSTWRADTLRVYHRDELRVAHWRLMVANPTLGKAVFVGVEQALQHRHPDVSPHVQRRNAKRSVVFETGERIDQATYDGQTSIELRLGLPPHSSE